MLKQRIFTAAALLTALLAALFWLPDAAWLILVALIAALAGAEWARLGQLPGATQGLYAAVTGAMVFLIGGAGVLRIDAHFATQLAALLVYGVSVVFWLLLAPVWMMKRWRLATPMYCFLAGWVVLLPTGLALVHLRQLDPWLLLAAMALIWIADIAAYFSGRAFGRRKLAPALSPGKTWEGVLGAVVGVVGSGALLIFLVSGEARPAFVVVVGFLVLLTAVSVEGDLFESMLKRQAGVKDSGTLLPGHGGILDRIDSLTSTLPMAALAVVWLGYGS